MRVHYFFLKHDEDDNDDEVVAAACGLAVDRLIVTENKWTSAATQVSLLFYIDATVCPLLAKKLPVTLTKR